MEIFNNEARVFRTKKLSAFNALVLLIVLLLSVIWSAPVSALGMGAANTESHIGEPLSVHIPIFNVKDPNNLSVILQRTDVSVSETQLQAKIEHLNFQLGIRITSLQPTTEPYMSFVVEVVDGTDVSSKDFTVLLDLKSGRQAARLDITAQQEPRQIIVDNQIQQPATLQNNFSAPTNSTVSGSILGPYDWAQAGQVPESFGPVLDGQSLWRVARRINEALGVSIDQMMWSLYELNRDQFSTDSITSLKAGAVLRIPTEAQASQLTELQAKAQIERAGTNTSSSTNSKPATEPESLSDTVTDNTDNIDIHSETTQTAKPATTTPSFDLTNLKNDGSPSGVGGGDQQSQQIIASLAEAVGNLTQEVIKKDKKISFLEEKISALEEYAEINSSDLPALQQSIGDAVQDSSAIVAPNDVVVSSEPSTTVDDNVPIQVEENVIETEVKSTSEEKSFIPSFSLWQILLSVFVLLVVVGLLFRHRLMDLVESLNLTGKDNEIEFDPTMFEQSQSIQLLDSEMIDPDLTVENNKPKNGLSQNSILDAIKTAVQSEDPLSPQTLIDLDSDDFSYTEMLSEDSDDENESELTFMQRFDKAIGNRDYDYARQLLDLAKDNELELSLYHYNRLRLYEEMRDEDAFYDYYCEVEQLVPSFSADVQTSVSKLVLKMAQH